MRLKYYQSTLFEIIHHKWWPQIKKMHLKPTNDQQSCFELWYSRAERGKGENLNVLIASFEDKPIAISMYSSLNLSDNIDIDFMLFVLPEYRNMGIGTKLYKKVKKITKVHNINIQVYPHDHISTKFFHKILPIKFKKQPKWLNDYWENCS